MARSILIIGNSTEQNSERLINLDHYVTAVGFEMNGVSRLVIGTTREDYEFSGISLEDFIQFLAALPEKEDGIAILRAKKAVAAE